MNDAHFLLERASSEIKSLRQRNEVMAARLDMFDAVMSALHGQPARERGGLMSPDVAYDIDKYLIAVSQEQTQPPKTEAQEP